jgi:Co/Zn/Cd efflux system component
MGHACCGAPKFDGTSTAYRRVLLIVIALNAAMFVVETAGGHLAGSQALQADALDFLGDAATYALTLTMIGRPAVWRANAALFKASTLAGLAAWVIGSTLWRIASGAAPEPVTMSAIGALALAVNVGCAVLLLRFRNGDANVRSAWLCSRNDAIGNAAVVLAAAGVWASGTAWPDLLVALGMGSLFLHSATGILRQALAEKQAAPSIRSRPAAQAGE